MSRGKARCKSPYLAHQLLMFSASANCGVVKITHSSFEMVLRTMKHTMIYHDSGPSSEVTSLRPVVWYWRWTCVTKGWSESSRSSRGERGILLKIEFYWEKWFIFQNENFGMRHYESEVRSLSLTHFTIIFSFILNLSCESNNDTWQACQQTNLVSKSNITRIMTLCVIVTKKMS
jgi:hypothetical protein